MEIPLPEGIRQAARSQYRQRGIFYTLARSVLEPKYPFLWAHNQMWLARAKVNNARLYHFVGDSHTTPFEFQKSMVVHHIGRATAHNLVKDNSSSDSKKLFWKVLSGIDRKRDIVVVVFGEIDCRIHIYYQFKKNLEKIPIEELMERTIGNYLSVLKQAREKGYMLAVLGMPPASAQENSYKYPFYGDARTRSHISRKFNAMLAKACRENGFPFIDVYSASEDGNGFIRKEFARDEVHLNEMIVPVVRVQLEKIGQTGKGRGGSP
ncbi:MAG: SGNH/GDSL hydrolase family protein [Candidatus Micrarchaeota archaeon]|nr:SGNH/GDSL hydrolase family protein [Candidatus Micrarchaeota archaeon]